MIRVRIENLETGKWMANDFDCFIGGGYREIDADTCRVTEVSGGTFSKYRLAKIAAAVIRSARGMGCPMWLILLMLIRGRGRPEE